MRRPLLIVACLIVLAASAPPASALPSTWTPTLLALAGWGVACAAEETDADEQACLGVVQATECAVETLKAEVGAGDGCPPR
jgi:hypothetical protein